MDLFDNIKISHKLSALMVGLTLGFILIGVADFIQISLEDEIREYESSLNEYQILLSQANSAQVRLRELSTRYSESEFGEESQRISDQHDVIQRQLAQHMSQAGEQSILYDIGTQVGDVESLLTEYDKVFYAYKNAFDSLGHHEDEGLYADFRRNAHEVEVLLSEYNFDAGYISYLQMRRHEKDYFSRGDEQYVDKLNKEYDHLKLLLERSRLPLEVKSNIYDASEKYIQSLDNAWKTLRLVDINKNKLEELGLSLDQEFIRVIDSVREAAHVQIEASHEESLLIETVYGALLFLVAISAAIGMFFVYKGIAYPLFHVQNVIRKVNEGNLKARVGLRTGDELGDLGRAFNKLLDERIQGLEEQSKENEQLNNSIIALIRALGVIAQKDLTVKVPVSADITGTISDAVNLLTSETAKTLAQVKDISAQVNVVSNSLQEQSDTVLKVAADERNHVIEANKALEHSARTMNTIAKEAESANDLAQGAIENTHKALDAVTETATGIQTIRESISETEKRIKRLGERSQEITGIVNLINTIAERTHILALNASMHAASAGEAGKGFAVVAEEVQRLAENAREATSNISSMVNNIRVETSDTVTTMNRLITEVADGTRLAERAGQQMAETESSTQKLVETVRNISEGSINQAKFTKTVRNRATAIKRFTEITGEKLEEQNRHTESLKLFAEKLVERVNIFTLPEDENKPVITEETIIAEKAANDYPTLDIEEPLAQVNIEQEEYDMAVPAH